MPFEYSNIEAEKATQQPIFVIKAMPSHYARCLALSSHYFKWTKSSVHTKIKLDFFWSISGKVEI